MKVVIISAAYPLRGGIAQYAGILYKRLKARGHQVNVITFKRQYPKLLFPGQTQMEKSKDVSVRIESEPILDSIAPLSWIRAFKRIRDLQPDLVLLKFWMPFFGPCFGTICWLVGKYTRAKILYICDNIIPHERRPGDIAITKFAFRKADSFIVQSGVVEQQLLSLFPAAKYKLVPHPVYDIFGEVMDKSEARRLLNIAADRVILFFGYVRAYKGLDLLLKAMPAILEKVNLKLLVVGEFYENEEKFRQLCDNIGVLGSVQFHAKFIPTEDVSRYFSTAEVVVLPYKSATQSGIVQIAYHLNKPCIVTDVGGLAEVVVDGRTGFVVPPADPAALASAVIRFYSENLEQVFVENVKQEKQKYSWDNMLDAIEELTSTPVQ